MSAATARVRSFTKDSARDYLQQTLKIDGADRICEATIGTNHGITRFTKSMLFDEKMGGTIHITLGNAYPE